MARQVLIVHGWSDTSKSFHSLSRFLRDNSFDVRDLWLGDYISLDDDVRVQDVARRMGEVIEDLQSSKHLAEEFDVIVHSTGGLVARAWLTTRYEGRADKCPMKRLVMLAPANYGSKLAATGKSLLGRVIKGYNNWFQTGQSMLNDLELSSPYQWELAQRDVVVAPGSQSNDKYYGADRVWPFVIVGSHPYASALRQIVNESGADGTVRVCAANLNAKGVTIDFTRDDGDPMLIQTWGTRLEVEVPLAVLPTRTHGSIVDPAREDKDNRDSIAETEEERLLLGTLVLEALSCDSFDTYQAIGSRWSEISEMTASRKSSPPQGSKSEYFHQYMQMNAYVTDDQGKPITDYFLEFFSNRSKANDDANVYLLTKVLEDVKKNSINEALRNLYFDRTDLMEGYYPMLPDKTQPTLYMSISAASPGKNIQYFEREKKGANRLVPVHLQGDATQRWLKRNTTHFVQMVIPRKPGSNVFKLTNANGVI